MAESDAEDDGVKGEESEKAEVAPEDVSGEPEPEPEDKGDAPGEPGEPAEAVPPADPVRRARRRAVKWVGGSLALVVLAAGGTAFALYEKFEGNIHKEHVEDQLGPNRPVKLNKSMNILLLGSDSRDGENKHYWSPDISGERSDTTILIHLSPNRDRAVAISFPRDSMVRVPAGQGSLPELPGDALGTCTAGIHEFLYRLPYNIDRNFGVRWE